MAEQSRTPTYRLTHALPPRLTREGDVLDLKAGWFTGCMPVAYVFFMLGIFLVWTGTTLSLHHPGQLFLYWGCLVVPAFGFAFWLVSRRTHFRLDRKTIQKRVGFRLAKKQNRSGAEIAGGNWPAGGIRGVESVQQFHSGGRFSQLAPGLHLLTDKGNPINLGAHTNPDTVRRIGRAISDFYSVPFHEHARDEAFSAFRRRKLILGLVALAIVAIIIIWEQFFLRG